jgi:hypothetical protein
MDFKITRKELNLLRFYGGIDSALYSVETEIDRTERNKLGDWELILKINKDAYKSIKSLKNRMNEYLNPTDNEGVE